MAFGFMDSQNTKEGQNLYCFGSADVCLKD